MTTKYTAAFTNSDMFCQNLVFGLTSNNIIKKDQLGFSTQKIHLQDLFCQHFSFGTSCAVKMLCHISPTHHIKLYIKRGIKQIKLTSRVQGQRSKHGGDKDTFKEDIVLKSLTFRQVSPRKVGLKVFAEGLILLVNP